MIRACLSSLLHPQRVEERSFFNPHILHLLYSSEPCVTISLLSFSHITNNTQKPNRLSLSRFSRHSGRSKDGNGFTSWCLTVERAQHFLMSSRDCFLVRRNKYILSHLSKLHGIERMVKTEAPYSRAVALFGLYTFFYTQPRETAPPLHHINHIPIQLGARKSRV